MVPYTPPRRGNAGWIVFWVLAGVLAAAFIGGAAEFAGTGKTYSMPGSSMANTVRRGDVVVTVRTTQARRSDVIVVNDPSGPGLFIRRVIGLPGDHVVCCDPHRRITVNGKALIEPYLYPGEPASMLRFNVTVPPGHLWLLGDHRSLAYDSRERGPEAVQVLGRTVLVFRSGRVIMLHTPRTFVAAGLAPPDHRVPLAVIGMAVSGAAGPALVLLAIVGVICLVIRHRRRRAWKVPAVPAGWVAPPQPPPYAGPQASPPAGPQPPPPS